MFMQSQIEPIGIVRLAHRLQAICHALGIAVLAARANLGCILNLLPEQF